MRIVFRDKRTHTKLFELTIFSSDAIKIEIEFTDDKAREEKQAVREETTATTRRETRSTHEKEASKQAPKATRRVEDASATEKRAEEARSTRESTEERAEEAPRELAELEAEEGAPPAGGVDEDSFDPLDEIFAEL